jgi:serine/threonine protein kinase/Tol biopolymer transport system component
MADRVGQQLGKYRLVRLLGQGGFADVYLGEHLHLNSQAAIKVMHTHLAQEDWESFRREARLIAGLVHPHIVRLLDFDVEAGVPFLVMQFAPNGTLRRRHARGNALAPEIILPYVQQVASALQYVHERRLVHRDIKPENLLIGTEHDILLSDFGVAIMAQSSRQQSMENVGGTMAYMAPEQIQRYPLPASDQYALGVVVYEWLTGARPFEGSVAELASKHLMVSPPPLRERAPGISPAVEAVTLRALAKDPQERFPSVLAFALALEEAISPDHASTLIGPRSTPPLSSSLSSAAPLYEHSFTTQVLVSSRLPTAPETPLSSDVPTTPIRRVSRRRALVAGLGGLVALGGGATWLALDHQRAASSAPRTTATPRSGPSPTPVPMGTTFFVYRGHTDAVYGVDWSPDGKQIVSGGRDGLAKLWDSATGADLLIYRGHAPLYVNAVAWSPKGTLIASAGSDATVQIWNAKTGKVSMTYRGHTDYVATLAWSPDATRIVSAGGDPTRNGDHTVHIWEVSTGRPLLIYTGHIQEVHAVAWSPDGTRIASASADTTVQVWNVRDGAPIFTYPNHHEEVWGVAWSPDGTRLVSGGHDGTVQVWSPVQGSVITVNPHHADWVNAVAWSPDGRFIASGSGNTSHTVESRDTSVQIWTVDTGATYAYTGHKDVIEALAWSPDGRRIVSASDDKTARVWEAV